MESLGYTVSNKGKTNRSRILFSCQYHGEILLHKPHPQKELKHYQTKQLISKLEEEGLL